jgi:flavin reductase (DIM6/NTAB) family NADH-FMN oxidoreductase RutF
MNASKHPPCAMDGVANDVARRPVDSQHPSIAMAPTDTAATSRPTPDLLRRVFATFATGVTLVGARRADGGLVGMTANSFASVSLDPPLVLFCVAKSLAAFKVYAVTSHFSISILAQAARSVSGHFARTGVEKWSTVAHRLGETGVPLLADALASMECEAVARHDAGDHLIVVGRVLRVDIGDAGEPLLFFGSHYRRLDPHIPNDEADREAAFLVWG